MLPLRSSGGADQGKGKVAEMILPPGAGVCGEAVASGVTTVLRPPGGGVEAMMRGRLCRMCM